MMTRDVKRVLEWAFWLLLLTLTTGVLLWARGEIDQSHVALTLLLVVLGGSANGGRPLGYVLALLGFVIIDYYFQPPYDLISVDKPLDWVVLVAFLASAFVTTELVARARGEARTARQRGEEIASLARIGAETLRHALPEDALAAITSLVQTTLNAARTEIRLLDPVLGLEPTPIAASGEPADGNGESPIILPLVIESRRVGIMTITRGGDRAPFSPADQRFLAALGYYAALGAERVRLTRDAAHAMALREENRAKDEVLAAVSHDLRTPLTTIKLLARNVVGRGDPDGTAIEDQVDRLAQLVTNVLDLSRIRAGSVRLDVELNTAEDLVGAAISRAAGVTGDRRIVAHVGLDEPVLAGRFDFVQSLRILGNLLDNALRYTPPQGVVDIETRHIDDWIDISVADRGPGVSPAERDRIFEPFYRARANAPDVGHAGLGLSIAMRLAELQGGTVTYAPRAGGGSVFTLRLPFAAVVEVASTLAD